jgi:DNA (cytosine-5)-methyltransferase 1
VSQMKLLDLFCKAGGAGMGYHLAGFDVVGVDIEPQPNYPFEFHQSDALEFLELHGNEFCAIHASPPCQAYTRAGAFHNKKHPELIEPTRELLLKTGKPYIIENVPGAPVRPDLILCGSMFGLGYQGLTLYRHRWFEFGGFSIALAPATCNHKNISISVFGHTVLGASKNGKTYKHPNERQELGVDAGREAMGISWMSKAELSQAIPPAYTKYIGGLLLANTALLSNTACTRQGVGVALSSNDLGVTPCG